MTRKKLTTTAPQYRKVSDSEVYQSKCRDEGNVYEFAPNTHPTRDIIAMVENIYLRRNAMTEQTSTRSTTTDEVTWFGVRETEREKVEKEKTLYVVKNRRDVNSVWRNDEELRVSEEQWKSEVPTTPSATRRNAISR